MKKIAIFNHKGGVSKTTTAFNVGWKLAQKGKKVLLVDALYLFPTLNAFALTGRQYYGNP